MNKQVIFLLLIDINLKGSLLFLHLPSNDQSICILNVVILFLILLELIDCVGVFWWMGKDILTEHWDVVAAVFIYLLFVEFLIHLVFLSPVFKSMDYEKSTLQQPLDLISWLIYLQHRFRIKVEHEQRTPDGSKRPMRWNFLRPLLIVVSKM